MSEPDTHLGLWKAFIMRRAFTLIELLVVIAIIAILAAILFPVFAQAKAAAKKASEITQMKQTGTSIVIYQADADDNFPSAYPVGANGTVYSTFWYSVPTDWNPTYPAFYIPEDANAWANSTEAYRKNQDLLKSPVGLPRILPGHDSAVPRRAPAFVNYAFNGLLHQWSATAVNAPSQLRMLSQSRGTMNIKGAAYSNPYLRCPTVASACRYVPSTPTCNGANGTWSEMFINSQYVQWVHNRGQVAVMSDTSAKFYNMNAGVNQRSDFRTSMWTRFSATGASTTEWQDTNFCHTLLFQPDFDFQNWGVPIEY
jgi:prepilin-type N-terminal cleavage/methylation domain-containing protein